MATLPKFTLVTRTDFRQNLAYWLKRIKGLGPIFITVHGKPVAKVEAVDDRGQVHAR